MRGKDHTMMTRNNGDKSVILAIDDQPNNLKVIGSVLEEEYILSIANNGKNALRMLENALPDLILLDIMMPEMDGFQVCEKLKENPATRDIPVIFLTAKAGIDDITRAFQVGAVDYIEKPFKVAEVKARIKTHLELHTAHQKIRQMNEELLASQEKLKETAKKLEVINQEKDKFFSIIAHDLRSPFGALLNISEMIRELLNEKDYDQVVQLGDALVVSAQKTYDLLVNLMSWAKMQTGTLEWTPEPLQLWDVAYEVIELHAETAASKSITLKSSVSRDTIVFADRNMMGTVIRNLVSNAIKFTRSGGEVRIEASTEDKLVTVSVTDTGIGMDQQMLGRLFMLSEQVGRTGTAGEPSTGIGLLLVKDFVEKNNGTIQITSEVGKGTQCSFTIPAVT